MDICICDGNDKFGHIEVFNDLLPAYTNFLNLDIYKLLDYVDWNVGYRMTHFMTEYELEITIDDIRYKIVIFQKTHNPEFTIYLYYFNQFMEFGFTKEITDEHFNREILELAKKLLAEGLK